MKKRYLLFAAMFTIGTITSQAQTISTYAGSGTGSGGYSGDGGPATAAQMKITGGIARDITGNLYIADPMNFCVRMVTPAGIISTFAGGGSTLGDGGPATAAMIVTPSTVAVDASGNVYIADLDNRIRKVTTAGTISTIVGVGGTGGSSGDGSAGILAKLDQPEALAFDATGNLYIGDYGNHKVRKVTPANLITTFAGNGTSGLSGDGSPATAAELKAPSGLAVDAAGNVYIADAANSNIRMVTPAGIISTFAGGGSTLGDGGPATAAKLSLPSGLAFDGSGNLYVADEANHRMRKITPAGIITTVAGDGTGALMGDGGPATAAQLNQPIAVVFDATNNMFISDNGNHRVRKVTASSTTITVTGSAGTLCTAKTTTLSSSTTGGTWTSTATTVATVGSSSGVVTGVAAGTATISYNTSSGGGAKTVTVVVCKVGVNNVNANDAGLKIFPNPNYGTFNIHLATPFDEYAVVTITNMVGVKIKELKMTTNQPLDLQLNAPPGIYFLEAVTPHGRWSEKITQLQ
ncbi:MAG: hypothetical protein JWQ38_2606 [Flavipsychrobacter sp.]|nr:hypothetical protein [Flavipsychrobacter sp.]